MNAFDKFDQPAFDVRSLDALKREAGRASPGALKAAAKQMEGIFVQMMMKSMRDATFKDELMNSQSAECTPPCTTSRSRRTLPGAVSSALPILSSDSSAAKAIRQR